MSTENPIENAKKVLLSMDVEIAELDETRGVIFTDTLTLEVADKVIGYFQAPIALGIALMGQAVVRIDLSKQLQQWRELGHDV